MNQLTILLTLKDRANYSKIWLENNLNPSYDYLIADGSLGSENEDLFSSLDYPNLKYIRYLKDSSIELFVLKVNDAISRIQTKYMMMCDNDDFINYHGITDCIAALEKNDDAISAGGPLFGTFQHIKNNKQISYSLPFRIVLSSAHLSQKSGYDAIQQLFRNYSHMWYSVFRTNSCKNIWHDIKEMEVYDLYLMELFQAELSFCYGKYIEVNASHYIRLVNPDSSVAKAATENDMPHMHKIYFDEKYRTQALRMSSHTAHLLNVDLKDFLEEFKYFYIGRRLLLKVLDILSLQFRSRFVKLLPYFPLRVILGLTNIFKRGTKN